MQKNPLVITMLLIATTAAPALVLAELTEEERAVLLDPENEQNHQQAPDEFLVKFETTEGEFVIDVHRDWAPNGVDRFYNLVTNKYYDGNRFFRVVDGFIVQWGMHDDPALTTTWNQITIPDDEVKQTNSKGTITFAKTNAPDSRTVQLFVNYNDNAFLDDQGFSPFGQVVEGMDVVEALYSEYGESPNQRWIATKGGEYLEEQFPELDYIISATVVEDQTSESDDGEAGEADTDDTGEAGVNDETGTE